MVFSPPPEKTLYRHKPNPNLILHQVKPLLQVTRQEEEMGQKEEELKAAKEVAAKSEAELKDISQKHKQVIKHRCLCHFFNFITDRK